MYTGHSLPLGRFHQYSRMTGPRYPDLIARLPETVPFVGPEVQERARGARFDARLGANENVFGPSPRAIEAMRTEAAEIWKYADSASHDLRHALAEENGCRPENIIVGEGIDGLLGYLTRLLVEEGDAVLTSDGAYPTFNYHVAGFGGVLTKLPYRADHEDLQGLLAAAQDLRPKLIYFANPDNPMATWVSGDVIEAALDKIPDGSVLILDEAYIEFAPKGTAPHIEPEDPRVIRFRTFSKAYGMAGARVGYGIAAAPLIRAFDKIRNHFGMNRAAQAGALAALKDKDWLNQTLAQVSAAKEKIAQICRAQGLTPLPSATNFVTVECGQDGDFARRLVSELVARGIFVRMPFVAPQDRCIRISAGTADEIAAFEAALPKALAAARG